MNDIILTWSVMNQRMDVYNNLVTSPVKPSTPYRVRIITNFMSAFTKPLFELVINSQVAPIISTGIQRMQSLDQSYVVVENVTLSDSDLTLWTELFNNVSTPYTTCYPACLPYRYNTYFGNATRYPPGSSTSPVTNFQEFYESPDLNTYWKTSIQNSGFDLTKLADQTYCAAACQASCATYQAAVPSFVSFVNTKIIDDTIDAVFLPALTSMVPLHTEVGKLLTATQQDNFLPLSIYPGSSLQII